MSGRGRRAGRSVAADSGCCGRHAPIPRLAEDQCWLLQPIGLEPHLRATRRRSFARARTKRCTPPFAAGLPPHRCHGLLPQWHSVGSALRVRRPTRSAVPTLLLHRLMCSGDGLKSANSARVHYRHLMLRLGLGYFVPTRPKGSTTLSEALHHRARRSNPCGSRTATTSTFTFLSPFIRCCVGAWLQVLCFRVWACFNELLCQHRTDTLHCPDHLSTSRMGTAQAPTTHLKRRPCFPCADWCLGPDGPCSSFESNNAWNSSPPLPDGRWSWPLDGPCRQTHARRLYTSFAPFTTFTKQFATERKSQLAPQQDTGMTAAAFPGAGGCFLAAQGRCCCSCRQPARMSRLFPVYSCLFRCPCAGGHVSEGIHASLSNFRQGTYVKTKAPSPLCIALQTSRF